MRLTRADEADRGKYKTRRNTRRGGLGRMRRMGGEFRTRRNTGWGERGGLGGRGRLGRGGRLGQTGRPGADWADRLGCGYAGRPASSRLRA